MKNQETIRKLAARINEKLLEDQWSMPEESAAIIALLATELATFGALLEIAELRTDCLNKPMRTGCNCYGCRTRAALADIQKG